MRAVLRSFQGLSAMVLSFAYLIFVLNPIQALSALIYPFSRTLCRRINRWCARSIWGMWVILAERMNKTELRFTGDAIMPFENALVLSNHRSMVDVMILLCFSWRGRRLGDMKWFVKDVLKWVPGLGWGMKFIDCIFLKRDWDKDKAGVEALFQKYKDEAIPLHLVSFLEGTRLRPEKLKRTQAFAEERGLYVPQHTLVPRTKGFVATLHGLRGHLDSVYDITIGYHDSVPSLLSAFAARVSRVDVHIKRYSMSSLPGTDAAVSQWAYDRFREKDQLLAAFHAEGAFPGPVRRQDLRITDWLRSERGDRSQIEA